MKEPDKKIIAVLFTWQLRRKVSFVMVKEHRFEPLQINLDWPPRHEFGFWYVYQNEWHLSTCQSCHHIMCKTRDQHSRSHDVEMRYRVPNRIVSNSVSNCWNWCYCTIRFSFLSHFTNARDIQIILLFGSDFVNLF